MSTPYGQSCRKDIPYPSVSNESVPSLIDNLVNALYGTITKTVVNRKVVWNIPCDPENSATILGIPRLSGEGLLCYFIRVFQTGISLSNLVGGSVGSLPYQINGTTTGYLGIGANGSILTSSGTGPQWSSSISVPASWLTGSILDAQLSANVTLAGNSFTGTGLLVRQNSPSFTTPSLGAATATKLSTSGSIWDQLNITVTSYPGVNGSVLKVIPHNGTEPLTVRGFGGYNGSYSTRIDSLRSSYIGIGEDLSSGNCTAMLLKDSRLSVSFNGTVGPFTAYAGFDASDFRAFNAYTNSSNYERGSFGFVGNTLTLATEAAGTGTVRGFQISIGGTPRFAISTAGNITTGTWQAGTIGVAYGGTGATTASAARSNLNAQQFVSNFTTGSNAIVLDNDPVINKPLFMGAKIAVTSVVSPYIGYQHYVSTSDVMILVDASSGSCDIILPAPSSCSNQVFIVKQVNTGSGGVYLTSVSGNIDGYSSGINFNHSYQSVIVVSDGNNYWIAGSLP